MDGAVNTGLGVLANLPEEVHWLCEKIEGGVGGKKIARQQDLAVRSDSTLHALMILSCVDSEESQNWLRGKIAAQLARCSQCVEEFYPLKRRFYTQLLAGHEKENLDAFFEYLSDWDIERVAPVLEDVVKELRTSPSTDRWYEDFRKNQVQRNAVYECLCSPDILRSATLKENFLQVCRTGKLKIDGPACGLIEFLFQDDEDLRLLAERSWSEVGPSISPDTFENKLLDSLESVIQKAESDFSPQGFQRLWVGMAVIGKNLSKQVIMQCVCGARYDPLKLAISHIQPNLPFLPALLRFFEAFMEKLGYEFWDAASPLTSSAFPELILNDPLFSKLLKSTPQDNSGEGQLTDLMNWMSSFISTVRPLNRPANAVSILCQLFKGPDTQNLPLLTRAISWKEGMKVLSATLDGVYSQSSTIEGETNREILRQANELFNEHIKLVVSMASTQKFDDPLMEYHMKLSQIAARETLLNALKLDVKVVKTDYATLSQKKPQAPTVETTFQSPLWDDLCERFPRNDAHFACQILHAVNGLIGLEKININSSDKEDLSQGKKAFNKVLAELEDRLLQIFRVLGIFSPERLKEVLADEGSRFVVFAGMLSSYSKISDAAEDILLQAYGVEEKSEALRTMFSADFAAVIITSTNLTRAISKLQVFSLAPKFISFSATLLDVLSDPFNGIINNRADLEEWEGTTLRVYWEVQWKCLAVIFKRFRRWAFMVDKRIMIEFTRDTMDYTEHLFDHFWTFEQAIIRSCLGENVKKESKESNWETKLLQDASKALNAFTGILQIQDPYLLDRGQALMCKILKLLSQKSVDIGQNEYFNSMRKILYPESEPGFDPKKPPLTNLSDVQKAELSVAVSSLYPDFVPSSKQKDVVDISDEDYGSVDEDELLLLEDGIPSKSVVRKHQTKLTGRSVLPTKTSTTSKHRPAPRAPGLGHLRVAPIKESPGSKKEIAELIAQRKAERAEKEAKKAALAEARKKNSEKITVDVSSSDEMSSEDEEEDTNALFKLAANNQRSIKKLDDPKLGASNFKNLIQKHQPGTLKRVKDNRARVAPDLSPLYKQILKWDFFCDTPFPPGFSAENYTRVAKSFSTYESYRQTFEPLLLLETWMSFLKAKEDADPTPCEVKIVSRMRADNFVELETTVPSTNDRRRWFESDVVLLSVSAKPLSATSQSHCLARVHNIKRKFAGSPVWEVQIRCDPPSAMVQNHMRNGGTLHGVKITSLTPLEREYGAMMCLQYYHLGDEIMRAKPSKIEEASDSLVQRTRNTYNVNEPQARAIISAVKNSGFSLIQGPPGTGKTKTVIGIVGALLTTVDKGVVIQIPGASKAAQKLTKKKLLVCAPSNAAVDELVIRLKQGVYTTRGEFLKPTIVRVGRSDAINADIKDVTLEELIDARMTLTNDATKGKTSDIEVLREQNRKLIEERNVKLRQMDEARSRQIEPPTGMQAEIDKLNAQLRDQRRQLNEKNDQKKESNRNAEVFRRRIQQEIMDEAQIICATLSGSGHAMLRDVNVDFETVIIDEAAQSVELSALIPLKFGCEKCILVGDPKQLPPTVLSREAAKFSYEKSLFVRMQENSPKDVHLLSIQYRMHPFISAFPSNEFYDGDLTDGDDMAKLRTEEWHQSSVFGPYRFFNVQGQETTGGRHSLINKEEVKMAISLFDRLTIDFPNTNFDGKVGIITPYKQQLFELRRQFEARYGGRILDSIDFNTTDAFQGRERDIIIFSCVRASAEGGVGFLADVRRMNVGLTRAKSSLFVIGNSNSLTRNKLWGRLVDDAKRRNLYTNANWRVLFGQTTRKNGPPMIAAPPSRHMDLDTDIGPNRAVQPLAHNGNRSLQYTPDPDAMDIDFEESRPQPPPPLPKGMPRVVPTQPKGMQNTGTAPQVRPAFKGICRKCGIQGHLARECRKPMPEPNPNSPRVPTVLATPAAPSPSLKRPAEEMIGGETIKRLHITESKGEAQPKPPEKSEATDQPQPSNPVPKKIIQKKPAASPFIQRRPRIRPPPPAVSNLSRTEARAKANELLKKPS